MSGGITSYRWQRCRERYLAAHPLCAHCARDGRTVAAAEVDHVVPRARGGAMFDWGNLQALCADHHRRKTAAENRRGWPDPERDRWAARLEALR